ncbi:DDE-domain-containing protein [Coniophora puteana RWD-64-598 SS2]|uniref:DDE-domain-containing protein n=1 Tax=Coniophora puteana (strain RWD-64-598) TaxID=741705 RepID=A0A5M3N4F0_CONPW|nr:DDE-domain-containing protein [Coniophora puteana RWD-64-598 SS2]EIW86302.1 DDE-domain-containing protein [Coniophora puteana RWD-64-598 SS2]
MPNLETVCGQAVNLTTHAVWMELLGNTIREHNITKKLIYGSDKVGFNPALSGCACAIGICGAGGVYQQQAGKRETITVIATICADGTLLPPAVIFKDKDIRVGYSKKGWINGEVGKAWIQQFDEFTKEKTNRHARLLLVDGHNSHYTKGFIAHARQANIHVLCYPTHSTHVYQGLDVVVFAQLENTTTHQARVMGFNPYAISKDKLAPSRATISQIFHHLKFPDSPQTRLDDKEDKVDLVLSVQQVYEALNQSKSASFLAGTEPIQSTSHFPEFTLPPLNTASTDVLQGFVPETANEGVLADAILALQNWMKQEQQGREAKRAMIMIQSWYCKRVQQQLAEREKKGVKQIQIMGDDETAKEQRTEAQTAYDEAVAAWQEESRKRDQHNEQVRADWNAKVTRYESEKAAAKMEKRKCCLPKPTGLRSHLLHAVQALTGSSRDEGGGAGDGAGDGEEYDLDRLETSEDKD